VDINSMYHMEWWQGGLDPPASTRTTDEFRAFQMNEGGKRGVAAVNRQPLNLDPLALIT